MQPTGSPPRTIGAAPTLFKRLIRENDWRTTIFRESTFHAASGIVPAFTSISAVDFSSAFCGRARGRAHPLGKKLGGACTAAAVRRRDERATSERWPQPWRLTASLLCERSNHARVIPSWLGLWSRPTAGGHRVRVTTIRLRESRGSSHDGWRTAVNGVTKALPMRAKGSCIRASCMASCRGRGPLVLAL